MGEQHHPGPITRGGRPDRMERKPSVVIVQDHIIGRFGGERVLLAMARAFPDAPIRTSFYNPDATFPAFEQFDIRPSALNKSRWLRNHHREALPAFPFLFSRMRID